jgi:hypothetical protein
MIFCGKRGVCQTPRPGLSSPQNNDFGTSKGGNVKQISFPFFKKNSGLIQERNFED